MGKRIYTADDMDRMGNSIMPHQRNSLFSLCEVNPQEIQSSHGTDIDRYRAVSSLIAGGTKLPHIVIDRDNMIMDGNTRLLEYQASSILQIKAYKEIGELL
jgi:hypothetical protein